MSDKKIVGVIFASSGTGHANIVWDEDSLSGMDFFTRSEVLKNTETLTIRRKSENLRGGK